MKSKILIVDDEEEVCNVLSEQLRLHGYATEVAGSGQEALEILKREAFDLIITDVRMPQMDGVELLQKVSKLYPDIAKILLTGYHDEHASEYAFESEGVFKIAKPYGEELMIVIKRALETRVLKKRLRNLGQQSIPEYARELLETLGVSGQELVVESAEENTTVFSLHQDDEV